MNVPTFEAKNRLSALLAQVARGAEVTITKRGVPGSWRRRSRKVQATVGRRSIDVFGVYGFPRAGFAVTVEVQMLYEGLQAPWTKMSLRMDVPNG
jgi:hypothetical protein